MTAELFTYKVVDGRTGSTSALRPVNRLRYQVYVNEWGFEKPEDHPEGLEQDEYDPHSIHFCAYPRHSDDLIGAARIILGSERPLPIERHFEIKPLPPGVRREQTAEISRLAVSKEFRCRAIQRALFGKQESSADPTYAGMESPRDFRRKFEHHLVRGLYLSLYRESKLRGVTHWFTVMAKGLYVILKRWGISFEQVGPARDYHGLRAPYMISIESIESALRQNDPALFNEAQQALT
jgi:N-acyl amino acid synthase of PEP-CTERM/exosortase system